VPGVAAAVNAGLRVPLLPCEYSAGGRPHAEGLSVDFEMVVLLAAAFVVVAALYSSVGHAGASGYIAVMALLGVAPAVMRPTALALNILVASVAVLRFGRAGYLSWRGLWPFLLGSVPLAALGGSLRLSDRAYYLAVAFALLVAAAGVARRAWREPLATDAGVVAPPVLPGIALGAVIGLLSGLTGTGGGIFLSPVVLLLRWAGPRQAAGISAPFILANSVAALLAGSATWATLPRELPAFLGAVLVGAVVGTWLGTARLSTRALLTLLVVVLGIAAGKLVLTG
jgi:uncharacterized membrane protein YfcA